ncbi:MAG: alpha-L-fucosidase [Tannerella sp.]|jgi:alpha-L-fucosidase|nr:alpha-L-fucosidase [Tannerella sp.]
MNCLKFRFVPLLLVLFSCQQAKPPLPCGVTPSEGQLQWHDADFYGMICLSTITYTNQEWGYGDEPASVFNPERFDAAQMVGVMKDAGMKGVLVVAKHHGGFCLWPTATTDYSVKSSPWKNGQGDMIREFADATRAAGLKFGVYLSPWDRNDPDYGTPKYVERYREQLRELHTGYGDIFLSWFDGANGGDGYYGGARERREIDRSNYYDWDNTWQLVREWQPRSAIFSDAGWDVRWVGNEQGFAGDPCWATYTPHAPDGGQPGSGHTKWREGFNGHRDGKYWMPAECDVPIRSGWFYHEAEDLSVKSPETLFDLYFMSVGKGAALDLGLAPDKSGQLHPNDVEALKGFGKLLRETFSGNLMRHAAISANQTRGGSKTFSPSRLTDADKKTYWSTDDATTDGELMIEFPQPARFNIVSLREYLPLGQRIDSVSVEVYDGKDWRLFAKASSVGAHRLLRSVPVEASKVRIHTWGAVCPALSEAGLYLEPKRMNVPVISRSRQGRVTVGNLNPYMSVYYTLDGSEPDVTSEKYTQPLDLPQGGLFKLRGFDGNNAGELLSREFGIAKAGWKSITEPSAHQAFDENPATVWIAGGQTQELCVDMGVSTDVSAFIYTPPANGVNGLASKYELYVADRPGQWGKALSKGEFGNIRNNPLPQIIRFEKPVNGRYIRFVATATVDDAPMAVAEIDILSSQHP